MMAAIEAAKGIGRGIQSVTLFEQEPKLGRKLAVTGAGRCNLSNDGVQASAYHGPDIDWMETLLERFAVEDLELITTNAGSDSLYKTFIEARFDRLLRTVALVNKQVEKFIHFVVGKAEFLFIGLTFPQIGGWRFINDRRGNVHCTRKLAHLCFI